MSSVDSDGGAWPYLIHDMVVRCDVCNLRCSYCGLAVDEAPPMAIANGLVGLRTAGGELVQLERVSDVLDSAAAVADRVQRNHGSSLKISGGELSALPGWLPLLADLSRRVPTVQLLTNGVLLKRDAVAQMAAMENLTVQISLDGPTGAANHLRGLSDRAVAKILKDIEELVEAGLRIEINVVLHQASLAAFGAFISWAARAAEQKSGSITLLPRPVRGPAALEMRGTEVEIRSYLQAVENAPTGVLPPKSYMDRVAILLLEGKRTWPCYVPYFVLGTDERGEVAVCTCGSHLGTAGSVFENAEVLKAGSFFPSESAPEQCSDCITQYELLNLYFEGSVSANECAAFPFVQTSERRLEQARQAVADRLAACASIGG